MLVNLDPSEIAYVTAMLERRREELRARLHRSIGSFTLSDDAAELRRIVDVLVKLRHGLRH